MISLDGKTDNQVKLLGLEVLQKELGVGGLIRFLQQYERGQGDYTAERREWQKDLSVEGLGKAILNQ